MHIFWESSNKTLLLRCKCSSFKHLSLEITDLLISRELSSEQEPQHTFWNWLTTRNCLWCLLSNFKKIIPSIFDSILWMKLRSLIQHARHTSHSSNDLSNIYISNLSLPVLFIKISNLLLSACNCFFHFTFEHC